MPRKAKRNFSLETPTARQKLKVRTKPFYHAITRGLYLGYRRNKGIGSWSIRGTDGHGHEWVKRIGFADDSGPAAPPEILTFWQAVAAAQKFVRGDADDEKPVTLDEALTRYEAALSVNGDSAYNSRRVRVHLPPALLAKPVSLLTADELRKWRDSLATTLAPATVNRILNCAKAALNLSADLDPRINRAAFKVELVGLSDAQKARNLAISDAQVKAFVREAFSIDRQLGILMQVLAETGARPGQVTRLTVSDLRSEGDRPSLMMPKSGKGGGRARAAKKAGRYAVAISTSLAALLKVEAAGRSPDARLLRRADGSTWAENPNSQYRKDIQEVVRRIGLDPSVIGAYCLRHSSIVRMIFAGTPLRLIGVLHDSSAQQIERNYSAFIGQHESADQFARRNLLDMDAPAAAGVVVPLRG